MSAAPTVSHPLCARLYAKQASGAEAKGLAEQRQSMLHGLAGSVVEIGAGNGLNFGHYSPAVTVVHAFEPDPYLRRVATEAAAETPRSIHVGGAAAEGLPLADASVDAAVASLVLCSVSDIEQAIGELHRVLRPGGELRFNEHVVSERRAWRVLQRTADATLWPIVSGGCHLGRDTRASLERGGFEILQVKRFGFRVSALDPPKSHLLGIARRV
jgi:ubiquinone/menaquinone biosynthesis C-methylase UbiE